MYFTIDRAMKYGWGVVRLFFWLIVSIFLSPQISVSYFNSLRWIGHVYMGSMGALMNVEYFSFKANIVMLLLASVFCFWDLKFDYSILVNLAKTFGGDFLAGKLDTTEWKIVLFFVFAIFTPFTFLVYAPQDKFQIISKYSRIFILSFITQIICEYGDQHFEHITFFRHRYSYETFNALFLLAFKLERHEFEVILFDLVTCFAYRCSNYIIILMNSNILQMSLFQIFGLAKGITFQNVTDPQVAGIVMKTFNSRGDGLEKHLSTPAWKPIISLESVDGDQWQRMRKNFDTLLKTCPESSKLVSITKRNVEIMLSSNSRKVIDAQGVVKLTIACFIEYLFDRPWQPEFDIFIKASWEWRKEISQRGKGDIKVKQDTVDYFVNNLIKSNKNIYEIFGERWSEPEYYSLILQPFIISPSINVSDIMVSAVDMYMPTVSNSTTNVHVNIDEVIRHMHPFPIFERFVTSDVIIDGVVKVKANTHVIMFTSDFKGSDRDSNRDRDSKVLHLPWLAFGAGQRMCGGKHLAMPLLQVLLKELTMLPNFKPALGHRYSGRNNDGNVEIFESWYFMTTVFSRICAMHA